MNFFFVNIAGRPKNFRIFVWSVQSQNVLNKTLFAMNSLKFHYTRMLCFTAFVMFAWCYSAQAQSVAKIDLNSAQSELPPPPTSVADALSKATCARGNCNADALFKAFDGTLASVQKQWAVINAGQAAQVDSAKHIAAIMQPVAGKNVSTTQQLEQAKQIPGMNTAALSFGQQMQDPAFKAKFAAMSQEQKLQYIQSSGMTAPPPAAPPPPAPDPAAASLAALSDTTTSQLKAFIPGFDSAMKIWNDTTFIFGDSASMLRLQNAMTTKVDSMALVLANIIVAADSNLNNAIAAHNKQLQAIVLKKKLTSISDDPGYHSIKMNVLTKEIADENAALPKFAKTYADSKAQFLKIIAAYNKALMASNYCASFTTGPDQQLLTGIAQTQINSMGQIGHYETILKQIYDEEANLGTKQQSVASEKITPYKENSGGEATGG